MLVERGKQLTLIRYCILAVIGFTGGVVVSAGVFAFITLLGVVNRLASKTNTARHVVLYENLVSLGGVLGNTWCVYQFSFPVGQIVLLAYGVCGGIFIGCQAMALTEVLKVITVFAKRVKIKDGMPYIVASIAIGKAVGAYLQLYLWKK